LIVEKCEPGIYHATCQGSCSWHKFAAAILEEAGWAAKLTPIARDSLSSPVKRPRYSVLDNVHLKDQGLDIMPPWREALCEYLSELFQGDATL
jgi:dTDP-4-dehydrorhamnose reductase